MSNLGLWVGIGAALLSSFFGANHYALHHFSRNRLEEILEQRGKTKRLSLIDHADEYVLLTGVLRSLLNLLILLSMVAWLAPPTEATSWWQLLGAFGVAMVIIAVVVVAVPNSWGRYGAESLLAFSLPVLAALNKVLRPFMTLLHAFDPVVRRLLGVTKTTDEDLSEIEQEILDKVSEGESTGLVDEAQADMIEAIVEFPSTTVDQIMTPRTDIIGIEADNSLAEIKRRVRKAGHSRFPVYEENLDHILGVLYVKDLLALVGEQEQNVGFDLRSILRQAVFVPESKTLRDLMPEMKSQKVHLALVLDEYGGTAGLVTFEDIVEEIVGEVSDEYEPESRTTPSIDRLDERFAEVDGRAYIDDVNDTLAVRLPEDEDYDTIGGFVFSTLGHIPQVGESFDFENLRFTVTEAEQTRVNRVKIEVLGPNGANGHG